jgi:hypothetical protein
MGFRLGGEVLRTGGVVEFMCFRDILGWGLKVLPYLTILGL